MRLRWRKRHTVIAAALVVLLAGALPLWLWRPAEPPLPPPPAPMPAPPSVEPPGPLYEAVTYDDIAGWASDDHTQALRAFRISCAAIVKREKKGKYEPLVPACEAALALKEEPDAQTARAFFEEYFIPHRINSAKGGLLTGYYEPELEGSRTRSKKYNVPVLRRPPDLIELTEDLERAKNNRLITAVRPADDGVEPYPTRREIEQGALDHWGLEFLYLNDPVDAYYMHVQGSARIRLAEGGAVRIGYAAKNGHPYSSIGSHMLKRGIIPRARASSQGMRDWLRAHPKQAREIMWVNKSYIFFRELAGLAETDGPLGAQGVPLTAGRSLAVDGSEHVLGTPVWVAAPGITHHGEKGFARLMVAQDVGSAIRGLERGDIFWGSGDKAGDIAGRTYKHGRFTVLLPKAGLPAS